jgi:hypothetical protein
MRFIEAIDLAHRFGAKAPELHEDDPRVALWIGRVAELPLAQQQGRLAEAIARAARYAGQADRPPMIAPLSEITGRLAPDQSRSPV